MKVSDLGTLLSALGTKALKTLVSKATSKAVALTRRVREARHGKLVLRF